MLDEFRSTLITWDKATSRIYSPVTANASDENGRKLVVQIVNSGQVEDLTGATLHLYWETRDKLHDGLDVFNAVDLKKGEFELSYTTGMLSNQGVLNANLVLIDTVGRVVSERFKITVTEGIDNDAIQSENSFSSLTQALIDVSNLEQNYAPRLNDLTAQLQQTKTKLGGYISLAEYNLTDYADVIQNAIDDGMNIEIPNKRIPISRTIVYDWKTDIFGLSQSTSIIEPTDNFVGSVLFQSRTDGKKKLGTLSNLTFDAKRKVDVCVNPRKAEGATTKDITCINYLDTGLLVGTDDESAICNACFFNDIKSSGDMTYALPYASYPTNNIRIGKGSMDNNFHNIFCWNAKISNFRDDGGSNRVSNIHVWGDLPGNFPEYNYEMNGIGTVWSNIKADSPRKAAIKLANFQNFITGFQLLLCNTVENGFTACYFEFANDNNDGTKISNGKASYVGLLPSKDADFSGTSVLKSPDFSNNQIISGWRYLSFYDTYMSEMTVGYKEITITFPKPLSDNNYLIDAQGTWDCGNVLVNNKTTTGFTIVFEFAPTVNSMFLYKFHARR